VSNAASIVLHATCVSLDGKGVLLLGEPGSGKSDLALRLIDGGAMLVADDQVLVRLAEGRLHASPPRTLEGLLEARGVGIIKLPNAPEAPLGLAVRLVARGKVERLPEPDFFDCLGIRLPLLSLHAFDDSTGAKIRLFFRTAI
jgi:HPr kinase/phosphorylase